MSKATILTQEQTDILSNDLVELINKITKFEKELDPKSLKNEIKESVIAAMNEGSLAAALKNEDFELEQNINELKKVKKYFIECKNEMITKYVSVSIISVVVGAFIATFILKFI